MLNVGTGVIPRPRRAARHRARTATAVILATGLGLLAACSGSPPSTVTRGSSTAAGSTSSQQLAFSRCMRSNGVPNWPDLGSSGGIAKEGLQQLGVTSSQFQAAQTACAHLLPNGGSGPNQAEVQERGAQALRFSQCTRTHGVTNFPDPDSTGRIPDPATVGIEQGSAQFRGANQACGQYRPPYMPSNAAYNDWAASHDSASTS